jgi:hypothetical protein
VTSQIDDRAVLRSLEQEGAIGPPVRIVRAQAKSLDVATKQAARMVRAWSWEGYDLAAVTITARLARCDDFSER